MATSSASSPSSPQDLQNAPVLDPRTNNRLFKDFRLVLEEIFNTPDQPNEMTSKAIGMKLFTAIYDIMQEPKTACETNPAAEIYAEIKRYLEEFLIQNMQIGEALKGKEALTYYSELWERFHLISKTLNSGSGKLNKTYINSNRNDGVKKDDYEIYWLSLITWKELVFEKLHQEVTDVILDLIDKERGGETIDGSAISIALGSYVELGIVDKEEKAHYTQAESIYNGIEREEPHLTIYHKHFENHYWKTTESLYMKEARDFLKENTDFDKCTEQMQKRLQDEEKRAEAYLHKSTGERVKKTCQVVFRMISDSCSGWNSSLYKYEASAQ